MKIDEVWEELDIAAEEWPELSAAIAAHRAGSATAADCALIVAELARQSDTDWAQTCKRAVNVLAHALGGLEPVHPGTATTGRCPKCTINGHQYWAII